MSTHSLFFEYFRVPYQVDPATLSAEPSFARSSGISCATARWCSSDGRTGPTLSWPRFSSSLSPLHDSVQPRRHTLGPIPFSARVLPDRLCELWLRASGGDWRRGAEVRSRDGRVVAAEWHADDGRVFLPYDPDEVIYSFWSERYAVANDARLVPVARRAAAQMYYRVRPALPRRTQIALRRGVSRLQARTRFPRWPMESALHDFYDVLLEHAAGVALEPVPWLAPWPGGRSWALVLTHDVETRAGYESLWELRDIERSLGYRSSWNFVPRRYDVEDDVASRLQADGHEVGLHGLYHDGRDLESLQTLLDRLPAMRGYAERWGAAGFRAPATQRAWGSMPLLQFDYDSSYPDTDPFEPQAGGCCTWLPFFNDQLVELPITVPQDHTLFVILREPDGRLWSDKVDQLRRRGGMALLITHPDYLSGTPLAAAYRTLLERYADDATAWRALPRDAAAWWRRRAASTVVRTADAWDVVGPAADEATIAYAAAASGRRP